MLIHLAEATSTNDHLRDLASRGAPAGLAVLADHQSAGRGRLGRAWLTGDGLALSVLLRPRVPAEQLGLLCLGAAVAIAERLTPLVRIKWPNDLVAVDGRKLGGLLAEAEWSAGALAFVVIGVGLNLSAAPSDLPAASLYELDGVARDRVALAEVLAADVLSVSADVERAPGSVLDRWRSLAHTLGRDVQIGDVRGVAEDVDATGALCVRTRAGALTRVLSGDVVMVAHHTVGGRVG